MKTLFDDLNGELKLKGLIPHEFGGSLSCLCNAIEVCIDRKINMAFRQIEIKDASEA